MDPPPDPSKIPAFPSVAAQGNAQSFAATTLALHGIALMVFGARMWSRCFPVYRMHRDDYVCAIAYVRSLFTILHSLHKSTTLVVAIKEGEKENYYLGY